MESQLTPAEELPALYRGILDGVARLERMGERRLAAEVRSKATAVYSGSWNDGGRRRLAQLQERIDRTCEPGSGPRLDRGRAWRLLQRSVATR